MLLFGFVLRDVVLFACFVRVLYCYVFVCLLDCDVLRGVLWFVCFCLCVCACVYWGSMFLCGLIVIMCVVTWFVVVCFVFCVFVCCKCVCVFCL